MVYAAVSCLKANQVLAKSPLTQQWFQEFMKNHLDLFRTLQTKPIAQVRVSAIDVEEVKDQFYSFCTWCEERGIKASDVLNFNKASFWVKVALREEIIVLAYVKEVSILF